MALASLSSTLTRVTLIIFTLASVIASPVPVSLQKNTLLFPKEIVHVLSRANVYTQAIHANTIAANNHGTAATNHESAAKSQNEYAPKASASNRPTILASAAEHKDRASKHADWNKFHTTEASKWQKEKDKNPIGPTPGGNEHNKAQQSILKAISSSNAASFSAHEAGIASVHAQAANSRAKAASYADVVAGKHRSYAQRPTTLNQDGAAHKLAASFYNGRGQHNQQWAAYHQRTSLQASQNSLSRTIPTRNVEMEKKRIIDSHGLAAASIKTAKGSYAHMSKTVQALDLAMGKDSKPPRAPARNAVAKTTVTTNLAEAKAYARTKDWRSPPTPTSPRNQGHAPLPPVAAQRPPQQGSSPSSGQRSQNLHRAASLPSPRQPQPQVRVAPPKPQAASSKKSPPRPQPQNNNTPRRNSK